MENEKIFVDCSIVKEEYSIQEHHDPKEIIKENNIIPEVDKDGLKIKEENPPETVQFTIEEVSRERNHQCNICGKYYYTVGQRNEHLKIHSNEKNHQCPLCPFAFPIKSRLKKHMIVHEGNLMLECNICGKVFKNQRSLDLHLANHMTPQRVQCEICKKMLKTKSSLKEHCHRVHCDETSTKAYTCEECGKSFGLENILKRHMITHSDEKNYCCTKCLKRYKHNYDFKKHQLTCKVNVVPTSDSNACSVCGKTFPGSRSLVSHMKKHTGKQLFCPYCNRKFSYVSNFMEHLKDNHKGLPTGEILGGPIYCTICNGTFESLDILKKHVLIHQNNQNEITQDSTDFSKEVADNLLIKSEFIKSEPNDEDSTFD